MKNNSNLKKLNLKAYLTESSKDYISSYQSRLEYFIEYVEGNEKEFLEDEILYFENCIHDYQNHESSTDGYSNIGPKDFSVLSHVLERFGVDKFYYSTKRKLEFLENRKSNSIKDNTIYLAFEDEVGVKGKDNDKTEKKPIVKKKKESLESLSVKAFFKKIRKGKISHFEKYIKTQQLTDTFDETKLKLLYYDFRAFYVPERDAFDARFSEIDVENAIQDLKSKGGKIPTYLSFFDKSEEINKEELLYPFEFFSCYQYETLLEDEIKKHKSSTRDYSEYNIKGHEIKYDINYNKLVSELVKTFDNDKIGMLLNTELYKLKKINREGFEKNKGELFSTYKSRANWIENSILIFDNEYLHTKKLVFKTAIKWCEEWREKFLPLFDPYSPEEKKERFEKTLKPLWKKLNDIEVKSNSIQENVSEKSVTESEVPTLEKVLCNYGFDKLIKIAEIPRENRLQIYTLINNNSIPYKIALLDFLGFIDYLIKDVCKTKDKTYHELAKILNEDYRSIKGNYLVLNPISKENKIRYTAHLHKETVERDYQNLK